MKKKDPFASPFVSYLVAYQVCLYWSEGEMDHNEIDMRLRFEKIQRNMLKTSLYLDEKVVGSDIKRNIDDHILEVQYDKGVDIKTASKFVSKEINEPVDEKILR